LEVVHSTSGSNSPDDEIVEGAICQPPHHLVLLVGGDKVGSSGVADVTGIIISHFPAAVFVFKVVLEQDVHRWADDQIVVVYLCWLVLEGSRRQGDIPLGVGAVLDF